MQLTCIKQIIGLISFSNRHTFMDITANKKIIVDHSKMDRIGVFASILCAIHCALTPLLLILLPTFGKAWAHPSTHWGMAIIVIPIAIFMMIKGYKKHGKKWVLVAGTIGVLLIIVGAILPYLEPSGASAANTAVAATSTTESGQTCSSTGCVDNCCPSIVQNEAGESSLYIPPASIVTNQLKLKFKYYSLDENPCLPKTKN